ncbi:hypothetical protein TRVL_06321 [Trypanosoma vivax]|nr:hypothetical protein TRVL_06321 [Trypanosoma vivax]
MDNILRFFDAGKTGTAIAAQRTRKQRRKLPSLRGGREAGQKEQRGVWNSATCEAGRVRKSVLSALDRGEWKRHRADLWNSERQGRNDRRVVQGKPRGNQENDRQHRGLWTSNRKSEEHTSGTQANAAQCGDTEEARA